MSAERRPHVARNSGCMEWYTPAEYIEAARRAMGSIDLDPASSEIANRRVGAARYYTAKEDGLSLPWHGNVWLNPPYARKLVGRFADKLVEERGRIRQAVILVNNATETAWFAKLAGVASAVCFPGWRVKFLDPEGNPGSPLQGQAVLYVGDAPETFRAEFARFGWVGRVRPAAGRGAGSWKVGLVRKAKGGGRVARAGAGARGQKDD